MYFDRFEKSIKIKHYENNIKKQHTHTYEVFFTVSLNAQNCGTGNVTLSSQAEVDTFISTYSGTCDTVDGNLTIQGSNITDVSSLSFLTTVNGQLFISLTNLITTNGLHNITTISSLNINQNFNLESMLFSNLTNVNTFIRVNYAASLIDIDFSSLTTINGSITFGPTINNDISTTLNYINIYSLLNLATINFASLPSVPSYIALQSNSALTTLNFDSLTAIGSYLVIRNTALTNVDKLSSLTSIGSYILLDNNVGLINISGLRNLLVVSGNLNVTNNTVLDECCILENFVDGSAYISGTITLLGNNTNCNSIPTIITSCAISQMDTDTDNIIDTNDNCINTSNPNQEDTDADGIGDACDNCPNDANALQEDANNNGIGDACEASGTGADTGLDTGGLGIGTADPKSQLEITKGDIFIKNIHRGVIMKAPNGKCFRVQPNNEGVLKSTEITCPDN